MTDSQFSSDWICCKCGREHRRKLERMAGRRELAEQILARPITPDTVHLRGLLVRDMPPLPEVERQ